MLQYRYLSSRRPFCYASNILKVDTFKPPRFLLPYSVRVLLKLILRSETSNVFLKIALKKINCGFIEVLFQKEMKTLACYKTKRENLTVPTSIGPKDKKEPNNLQLWLYPISD